VIIEYVVQNGDTFYGIETMFMDIPNGTKIDLNVNIIKTNGTVQVKLVQS